MNKKQQKDNQQQQQQQQQQTAKDILVVHHAAASSIEFSHRGPVTDITWIPKELEVLNNGDIIDTTSNPEHNQFVSVSLDGQVFFWDLRFRKELRALDLVWRPFIKVLSLTCL
jgi:WD40 repeat protein